MTVSGLWRYCSKSFRSFLSKRLGISCPRCRGFIPAFQSTCPGCGSMLTVEGVFKASIDPHRERFKEIVAPTPTKRRIFQWVYLLGSALTFWITFGVLEHHYADRWILHALLSVVYLAVFLLVSRWVIPQKAFYFIARQASKPIKLGIVFNYLTGLFFLQMYLTAWWSRSLMLAGLFAATYFGAWLFWAYLWPTSNIIGHIFVPPEPSRPSEKPHDPRARQGRNVGVD